MRIKVGKTAVLVQRVLLDIETAGVDMRAEDGQALLQRLVADVKEHDGLVHVHGIDLVARLQFFAFGYDVLQIAVTRDFRQPHGLRRALALRLTTRQKRLVPVAQRLQSLLFALTVLVPNRNLLLFLSHN